MVIPGLDLSVMSQEFIYMIGYIGSHASCIRKLLNLRYPVGVTTQACLGFDSRDKPQNFYQASPHRCLDMRKLLELPIKHIKQDPFRLLTSSPQLKGPTPQDLNTLPKGLCFSEHQMFIPPAQALYSKPETLNPKVT